MKNIMSKIEPVDCNAIALEKADMQQLLCLLYLGCNRRPSDKPHPLDKDCPER